MTRTAESRDMRSVRAGSTRDPSARQTAPQARDARARTSERRRAQTRSWRTPPVRSEDAHTDQESRSTRWTAYCEPLRLPTGPLPEADERVATPHPTGSPTFRRGPCRRAVPTYPGGPQEVVSVRSSRAAAFPEIQAGRHPHHRFRGLPRIHSCYGPHAC